MLDPMQQTSQEQASSDSSHFAGLLAALALPRDEPAAGVASTSSAPLWNDGDLGEDVATLSYERALRAHARYHPAERGNWAETQVAEMRIGDIPAAKHGAANSGEGFQAQESVMPRIARDGDLRTASVTIRLNKVECERLRKRAGEAGLTVSAYLRSCTFEAEALRAQVKKALEEMRRTEDGGTREQGNKEPQRRNWFGWISRMLPWRQNPQTAQQS